MIVLILAAYLATSIAIPLVWDFKHQQKRPTASNTGSMRVRGL